MTDYGNWDSKATRMAKEAEEEEKRETEENNKALGLEDGPMGPARAKAIEQREEMERHGDDRQKFIDFCNSRVATITHGPDQVEPVILGDPETEGKAVRIKGSEGVTYVVPEGCKLIKLEVDGCQRVQIQVKAALVTSTLDICRCEELDVELAVPLGAMQVDECTAPVRVRFTERDHVGRIYHQNSPGLAIGCEGADGELHGVGRPVEAQFFTCLAPPGAPGPLMTAPVVRGEGDMPLDMGVPNGAPELAPEAQLEPEKPPAPDELARQVDAARQKGNDMFRANDFMMAAMQYTQAIELDPTVAPLWSNRANCFLKLGQPEKALEDSERCVELDPSSSKGWFRKGMSLHGLQRYREAIPALLEAEKLEPTNKQIIDAIKFAQLKARMQAANGTD